MATATLLLILGRVSQVKPGQ